MERDKRRRRGEIMPPLLTFIIMLILLLTAGISRVSVNSDRLKASEKNDGITSYSMNNTYISESQFMTVLQMKEEDINNRDNKEDGTFDIFINCLRNQVSDAERNYSTAFSGVRERILELIDVMNIEHERDFTKMSMDGRAVAIDIATKIYDYYGLEMNTDLQGNIEQIADKSGNVIYQCKDGQYEYHFQAYGFVFLVGVILLLFVFIYKFDKRTRFQKEDVFYDEFNEKRYT